MYLHWHRQLKIITRIQTLNYTGCIKKKVIELQRAIVSELLCVFGKIMLLAVE